MEKIKLDEIGYWSEIKLDIIKKYAVAYSVILNKQSCINSYYYIDGFAGAGIHISKDTKEFVPGSPANALNVNPPFSEYHFIDLNGDKADMLRELGKDNPKVNVHEGDCNKILLDKVFPIVKYENYNRALCLLDPYGLHLKWEVMYAAGQSKAIEIFLNFSVMDMNMNVLRNDPGTVDKKQIDRMNAFWGDGSWREAAYEEQHGLFENYEEKTSNQAMAKAFRNRLKTKAGFGYVPEPMPMRNTTGAIIYYLFFASPKKTGNDIVEDIFAKYKNKGLV
jgi:three-Cys-motif partner protein